MRSLVLLGVVTFCVCSSATDTHTQGDTSLQEEDGVLQLKKGNFDKALKKYEQLLVHFCK